MIGKAEHKFIFIHIFKTAGTSVSEVLQPYARVGFLKRLKVHLSAITGNPKSRIQNAGLPKHALAVDYRRVLGDDFNSHYRFSFVRNPFDWHVSLYHFIRQQPNNSSYHLVKDMTFNEYVLWKCKEKVKLQVDFLLDEQGRSLVNSVGRVENIRNDFKAVCDRLSIPFSLPHRNPSKHKPYWEYYSKESVSLVKEAYARDFAALGYSANISETSLSPMLLTRGGDL